MSIEMTQLRPFHVSTPDSTFQSAPYTRNYIPLSNSRCSHPSPQRLGPSSKVDAVRTHLGTPPASLQLRQRHIQRRPRASSMSNNIDDQDLSICASSLFQIGAFYISFSVYIRLAQYFSLRTTGNRVLRDDTLGKGVDTLSLCALSCEHGLGHRVEQPSLEQGCVCYGHRLSSLLLVHPKISHHPV